MKRNLLFCFFWFSFVIGLSQTKTVTLVFNGVDSITQIPLDLESVFIQNSTVGCDTTIFGPTPSIVLTVPLGVIEHPLTGAEQFIIMPPIPNPFHGTTRIDIQQINGDRLQLTTIDAQGKVESVFNDALTTGVHKFEISSSNRGFLLLSVTNGRISKSIKLINKGNGIANNRITYLGTDPLSLKWMQYNSGFSYRFGDLLMFTSSKIGYHDKIIIDSPTQDSTYIVELTPITNPIEPSVLTDSVTDIVQTSATCGGNVIDDGGSAVTTRGVCWNTSPNPTIEDSITVDGIGTGSFVSLLTGLSPDSTYYVRAYATNSIGTGYGDEIEFTTLADTLGIPCPNLPTVLYEGRIYHTVQIGVQCWLRENLNVGIRLDSNISQTNNGIIEKYCYQEDENNCEIYGGLYQWDEMMQYVTTSAAQGICPDGWHIPYQEEWNILFRNHGGYQVAGGRMKSTGILEEGTGLWRYPNTGATNSEGFTAHPGGFYQDKYYWLGYGARFWVSEAFTATEAIFQALWFTNIDVFGYYTNRSYGISVRCLKDN